PRRRAARARPRALGALARRGTRATARARPSGAARAARAARPALTRLLDSRAAGEARLVGVEELDPLLGPLPAVVSAAAVEVDGPEALHVEAERLHLADPAHHHGLDALGELSTLRGVGRVERLRLRQPLGLGHGARGARAHVGQHLARALERPAALAHGFDSDSSPPTSERRIQLRLVPPASALRS